MYIAIGFYIGSKGYPETGFSADYQSISTILGI
jgi:hypothetical protein